MLICGRPGFVSSAGGGRFDYGGMDYEGGIEAWFYAD